MASIVSPIAQPSRPKSVSRPKRWSEEVEEGTVKQLSASCSEVVPKRIPWQCFICDTNKQFLCFLSSAYRFQIAGYRDVHEYRDVKQKEPVSDIQSQASICILMTQQLQTMDIARINESQEIPITKIACRLGRVGAFSQRATVKKCPLRTFVVVISQEIG